MTAISKTDVLAEPLDELATSAGLSEEARAHLNGAATRRQAIDALVAADLMSDAIRLLGATLDPSAAIQWANQCVRAELAGAASDHPGMAVVEKIEAWIRDPTDELRRELGSAALATPMDTPSSWAAMAVYWSGGSIAPLEAPPVEAPPGSMAKAAVGAVLLAGTAGPPAEINARLKQSLELGMQLAEGAIASQADGEAAK